DSFGKHIVSIQISAVLSSNRKRLARRPAGHHHYFPGEIAVVEAADIALMQWPFLNDVRMTPLIFAKCLASVVIPLDHCSLAKAGLGRAYGEASGTGEEFNTTHQGTSLSLLVGDLYPSVGIPKWSEPSSPLS